MIAAGTRLRARHRAGITLTEILIALLILSVGLVSVATLFPIGLLRLRDATRYSRSTYLAQSANGDISARNLLSSQSFVNSLFYGNNMLSGLYDPLIQDTPFPNGDWGGAGGAGGATSPGVYSGVGGIGPPVTGTPPLPVSWVEGANGNPMITVNGVQKPTYPSINGPGLPIAYDPLWFYEAAIQGFNPAPAFEGRFGAGIGFIREDPFDKGVPSAHGLQRINNFTVATQAVIPSVFVSPEDVVWQEPTNTNYFMAFNSNTGAPTVDRGGQVTGAVTPPVGTAPSPVIPDLSLAASNGAPATANDFHYSWIFTGALVNSSNLACFDGNIVVFENRPFGISATSVIPNAPAGTSNLQAYQVDGETVVEAIWGHGGNIKTAVGANAGYAAGAQRTVLLRWYASVPDPVVKAGDWIADVTYERSQSVVLSRWWTGTSSLLPPNLPLGIVNTQNNGEWDNLPAQRCYWYQVQKASPAGPDYYIDTTGATYRSMVVYINQNLQSRTLLTAVGTPYILNAALIAPNVVNVIPTTIFTR
jgi:hypothetical protein